MGGFPLPKINDTPANATLNLRYWQVERNQRNKMKTVLVTQKNYCATYESFMETVLCLLR